MHGSGDILQLVENIYDAVTGTAGVDGLAALIAREFRADTCVMPLLALPLGAAGDQSVVAGLPSATADMDMSARTAYAEHYHARNIWFSEGAKRGFPAVVLCHEVVPPAELVRSEWYDYCQKLRWFHCLGAQFRIDDRLIANPGILRPRGGASFDADDQRKLEQLLPHIQRATQLLVKLGSAERGHALTFDAFEGLGLGVLVVSREAKLLYINRVAEQTLSDGHLLTMKEGRLCTLDRRETAILQRVISDAALTSAGQGMKSGGTITISSSAGNLMLTISPLCAPQHGFGHARPAAIIVFPALARQFSETAIAVSYGLTPAETKLLAALLAGATLAGYATRRRISVATVRTHMKHILQKTGFHRQVDLVRNIIANPLMWRGEP